MQRYYAMMSSRPPPVSEDRRILPPPMPSQPQNIAPRAPTIPQPPGLVGHTRQSAAVQRRQDIQTPLPRDSLVLPSAGSTQRQDSSYAGRTVLPRRPSLEREQRPILPPGLSTSPGAHSSLSGQPPTYNPPRPRRDSLTPSAPQHAQQARRDSISAPPQGLIQLGRRDSIPSAPHPQSLQSIHRNSIIPQPPLPVRRATDPLPALNTSPPVSARRSSESTPRGQGLLVSTRVRFDDENLICPSPIPMHERRRGFHNRRGYVLPPPKLSPVTLDLLSRAVISFGQIRVIISLRCPGRSIPLTSQDTRTMARAG